MDLLSISASIIAVLQLTGTVIRYLNDVGDAPEDRKRILLELHSIQGMLYTLHDKAIRVQEGDVWSMTLHSLCVLNGPLKQFQTTLERLAEKLVPRGWKKFGRSITWPFQKEEVKELLASIERQKTLIIFAQQNDHIELFKAIKHNVENLHCEVKDRSTQLRIDDRDQKIRRWLNPPDPSVNYNKALKERFTGTGTWFVECQAFINWKTTLGSFLWLYGIPGCGKSILSSTIIEAVLNHCALNPSLAVLYFYFDFTDPEKQHYEKLIRSLITQLSSQCASTPQALESLYSSCMNGERQAKHDSLLVTLHQIKGDFKETFLIIDALDECLERQELLADLKELSCWKDVKLHILTTSRREKDIEELIDLLTNNQGRIYIQSVLVNDDICAYIHSRLQTDQTLKRWHKQPKVQLEIEDTLMKKADGMFRWAACQLDSLRNCLNLPELRQALRSLPKSLDDTYKRILCDIDESHYQYAFKILQWLTYSARPLRLQEVAEVIAIDHNENPRFDPEIRLPEPQDILTICSSLISLELESADLDDNKDKVLRLAHFSVKEYLVSDRILQGEAKQYSIQEMDAHISIQNDCLAYLLEISRLNPLNSQCHVNFPLAKYAAMYWTQHARIVERYTGFNPLLTIELLLTREASFLNWLRVYNPDRPWQGLDRERSSSTIPPPLYYAAMAGLHKSVHILLDKGADVNAQGEDYGNALQAGSLGGYDQVVQVLLDKGVMSTLKVDDMGTLCRRGH